LSRRSEQRRAAVFALYQHEVTGRSLDDTFERAAAPFTRALAHATADMAEELDPYIARHARGWTLERIAPLERAILRTALLEMLHPELTEGERPIPAEGAIDEAVETAKAFCGADAPGFVNGILAAVLREARGTDGGAHAA
jgi:N utilization substance protein B